MLHRRDREQLEQIEQRLRADDPGFTARFDACSRGRIMVRWSSLSRVLVLVLVLAALVAFLLGHAATGSVAAGVAIGVFLLARGWRLHSY